jgi:hypothetical protein
MATTSSTRRTRRTRRMKMMRRTRVQTRKVQWMMPMMEQVRLLLTYLMTPH